VKKLWKVIIAVCSKLKRHAQMKVADGGMNRKIADIGVPRKGNGRSNRSSETVIPQAAVYKVDMSGHGLWPRLNAGSCL